VRRGGLVQLVRIPLRGIFEECREAQEQGKTFHYTWLLLSITLVVGELSEDSQFHSIDRELPEAAKYTSLSATKDAKWIRDTRIFLVLMEMSIRIWIN